MFNRATMLAGAAWLLYLAAGGAIFAQENDDQATANPADSPVLVIPVAPDVDGSLSRDGSPRDWRGEVAADREAKGWGTDRPRSQAESRQNWIREYQRRDYYSGQERGDRFPDLQDRSDRTGANRNSFTPKRPDGGSAAEKQAKAYAAVYWMMKAQAEQERQR